ncbi:bifunctional enoyl-CoA hydratase/phosphate acetyltransferase [Halodesulfovibrio sp.]|jgi:phosphate butyryltransferase|uniref:bifunctional enoyl-CoA hydratase/phosphate acetyltransferase n=1 Tax=Halodesulfovibrio sp. TaxID=1912772 RepID=UPI0025DA26D1|nr:bifunctional enoyl-CoA hydratase/phosphate acetyltransferase [Halodesulfovibrio sp.]MCT4536408.1 bifunctional enoyl-CoA hydratase/phosphate acetyltransferase [Halodesulfovibrio sp.]
MPITSLQSLADYIIEGRVATKLAVAACAEGFVLRACVEAYTKGIAEPILVGDIELAEKLAAERDLDLSPFEKHHIPDPAEAVTKCIALVKEGHAGAIMKGKVNTDVLLRGVLNKETGMPPKGVLSHVGVFNAPDEDRLMLITDAGINIAPNMQRKVDIVKNALRIAKMLKIEQPKVAMLAATEKVIYPAMPATLDAQMVAKMAEQGEFGDALVAGPFALDLAVSMRAVESKGVDNPVAGKADILVAPDIESGNILYKSLTALMNRDMAGMVAGSEVPIVLPSRGDTDRTKFYSIALAMIMAMDKKESP